MPGTPHPIEAVIVDNVDVQKASFRSYVRERTALLLADADELNATDLEGQLLVQLKSTGRTYEIDTGDTTTIDDGVDYIRDANDVAYKKQSITGVDGTNGSDGTDPGVLLSWDVANDDSNPASGGIKASNDDLSLATFLYVSKTNRGGDDISSYLASIADSTNTAYKGHVILTRPGGNAQALFKATSLTDASGYVKIGITFVGGTTGFLAGNVSLQFNRAGDKGEQGTSPQFYETITEFSAAIIGASIKTAMVLRYSSTAPVADPMVFKKLAVAPSPTKAWHVQTADGAWWQLTVERPSPYHFGAAGTGAVNDRDALQGWLNYISSVSGYGFLSAGQFRCDSGLAVLDMADGLTIEGAAQERSAILGNFGSGEALLKITATNPNTTGQYFITLSNFTLDKQSNVGNCLELWSCVSTELMRLRVVRARGTQIYMYGGAGNVGDFGPPHVRVRGCRVTGIGAGYSANGMFLSNIIGVKLENNYIAAVDVGCDIEFGDMTTGDTNLFESVNNPYRLISTHLVSIAEYFSSIGGSYYFRPLTNSQLTIINGRDAVRSKIYTGAIGPEYINIMEDGAGSPTMAP